MDASAGAASRITQDQNVAHHTEGEDEAIGHRHEHGLEVSRGPRREAEVVFLYGGLCTVIVAP